MGDRNCAYSRAMIILPEKQEKQTFASQKQMQCRPRNRLEKTPGRSSELESQYCRQILYQLSHKGSPNIM